MSLLSFSVWGESLGTIRSEYSIEQFEAALQRFAHEKLPELIPKFDRIIAEGSGISVRLDFVYGMETNDIKKIRVRIGSMASPYTYRWEDYLDFTIEPKVYLDSPHVTKIHYEGPSNKVDKERILAWLKSLLGSEEPAVRFSIEEFSKRVNRRLTDYKAFSRVKDGRARKNV